MPTKHPQHDKIIEIATAFAEGWTVQRKVNGEWIRWACIHCPPINDGFEWRVKPETLRYRVVVMRRSNGSITASIITHDQDVEIFESFPEFVEWVHHDWQEVEVSK